MSEKARRIVSKTAAYSVSANNDRNGTLFNNRGASGSVTFTLPAPQARYLGWEYDFEGVADQDVVVAAATAGDVVTKNDAAANSVAASTSGEKIGAVIRATCIKTSDTAFKWRVVGIAVGHTYTVAT